ncbi:DUF805 domain-containing protein [Candidatus Pantoea multigeneris]|uniref:DUF805 domain-containing protein n=1 Tax=Candidatus Pantoea multigeneris TaxID=2608357 RepID=A0ABX0RLK1_9GAMM|nr:DUF805 domain-containing protein [Pantoea multigeneris]NIF24250.1 DUF805 domain-containing protein [Pantoea multigeneris]
MALTDLLNPIKHGFLRTFNYSGREARASYLVFVIFQVVWFCLYLKGFAAGDDEIGFIPLLLFVLPTLACGSRRINDAGYSRGVVLLLLVAPYLLFPFLAFPASAKEKPAG